MKQVLDRKQHFHAIDVARIRSARLSNFFLSVVVEVVCPAVFQETSHDADDADVLLTSGMPGGGSRFRAQGSP
jgi:hypothetical protein